MGFTALPVQLPFRFRFRSSSRAIQLRSLLLSLPFPRFPAPPLFLPLTLSDSLPFLSFPPFGFLPRLSFSTLSSFFFLPSAFHSFELLHGSGFFPFGLSPGLLGFCLLTLTFFPSAFPFGLASVPAFRFRFLPRLPSLSSFPPAFFSVLSNFFSGLPSLFSFELTYGLGFSALAFPLSFRFPFRFRFRFLSFPLLLLAAAFFFHSFELLFSAFRLSSLSGFLTAPASFLSDFPAGLLGFAHPIPFFLPLCLSASLPFLAFRFRFLPGPSSLSSFLPRLLFRSFELLFRPAVFPLFQASLRFRFLGVSGFFQTLKTIQMKR